VQLSRLLIVNRWRLKVFKKQFGKGWKGKLMTYYKDTIREDRHGEGRHEVVDETGFQGEVFSLCR